MQLINSHKIYLLKVSSSDEAAKNPLHFVSLYKRKAFREKHADSCPRIIQIL